MPKPQTLCYTPRPGVTPDLEAATLAACYRYILDTANKRDRSHDKSGPKDQEESRNDLARNKFTQ